LIREADLRDVAGRYHQECGKAVIREQCGAGVAIAVIGRKFGGVVVRSFGSTAILQEEAKARVWELAEC